LRDRIILQQRRQQTRRRRLGCLRFNN